MIENFSVFGETAQTLHIEFERLFYLMLPVFFSLAIVVDWFRNPAGSPDFLSTLKRAVIAMILVVGFQEISEAIVSLTSGIADRISDLSGFDAIWEMAKNKASSYPQNGSAMLLGFDDLFIALLSYLSYFFLYIARFINVALYHFMWAMLTILSPILILFTLFRGTLGIPINLFRSMIEVSSYKIIWAILSVMIQSLAFGQAYAADGDYLTVILLNFVIALAMLGTPMLVRSLVGSGLSAMSETLGMGAVLAMASVPTKAGAALSKAKPIASAGKQYLDRMNSRPVDLSLRSSPILPPRSNEQNGSKK